MRSLAHGRLGREGGFVSVWPEPSTPHAPFLSGAEGELVAASISVEPQLLERLLDTLAEAAFPINPQIYHNAEVRYVSANGTQAAEPATLVEFPAYLGRLDEVRDLLRSRGFAPESLWLQNLLDDIHSDAITGPAPAGSSYAKALRCKHAARAI